MTGRLPALDVGIPQNLQGLDRFVARKQIVKDLEALGLMIEVKKHKLMVPRCGRTGQIIEPMLTDQWFVAMTKMGESDPTGKSIAQKAIDLPVGSDSPTLVMATNHWSVSIDSMI